MLIGSQYGVNAFCIVLEFKDIILLIQEFDGATLRHTVKLLSIIEVTTLVRPLKNNESIGLNL